MRSLIGKIIKRSVGCFSRSHYNTTSRYHMSTYTFQRVLEVGDAVEFERRNGNLDVALLQTRVQLAEWQLVRAPHQLAGAVRVVRVNHHERVALALRPNKIIAQINRRPPPQPPAGRGPPRNSEARVRNPARCTHCGRAQRNEATRR